MKKFIEMLDCQFCEKNFESDKVRDHCHLTGKYRGPAQNLQYKRYTETK